MLLLQNEGFFGVIRPGVLSVESTRVIDLLEHHQAKHGVAYKSRGYESSELAPFLLILIEVISLEQTPELLSAHLLEVRGQFLLLVAQSIDQSIIGSPAPLVGSNQDFLQRLSVPYYSHYSTV